MIQTGQRFYYKDRLYEFVAEIVAPPNTYKIIQHINGSLLVGEQHTSWSNCEAPGWEHLIGQDKPI